MEKMISLNYYKLKSLSPLNRTGQKTKNSHPLEGKKFGSESSKAEV